MATVIGHPWRPSLLVTLGRHYWQRTATASGSIGAKIAAWRTGTASPNPNPNPNPTPRKKILIPFIDLPTSN
jgi:hypothetical protein